MIKKYYVYFLTDPRHDNRPFCVGKGSGKRSQTHLVETADNTENLRKFLKIQKIRDAGLEPGIEYFAIELTEDDAYALEADLILKYGRAKIDEGGILTNICIDSRPPDLRGYVVPEEVRKRRSEYNKANGIKPPPRMPGPLTEEHKAKLSLALTGRIVTEEQRKHLSALFKARGHRPPDPTGRPVSEDTRQKIGDAQRGEKNHRYGKHWSEEEKKQRSEFAKANGIKPPVRSGPMSDEQKAAIGAGNKGKKRSAEISAYLSSIRKGKKRTPRSEETKEKIRQSNIATKARQRAERLGDLVI